LKKPLAPVSKLANQKLSKPSEIQQREAMSLPAPSKSRCDAHLYLPNSAKMCSLSRSLVHPERFGRVALGIITSASEVARSLIGGPSRPRGSLTRSLSSVQSWRAREKLK
jgi:hypothetical protein